MGNMMLNRFQVFTIMTFVAVNEALAQATPPATPGSPAAPAAPATTDDGAPWLWIIIGLALLAAIVWYFMRGRSRTTTTGPSTTSGTSTSRTNVYDKDDRK
ncbi:hypothetical protein MAE02_43040 [Microvirga aerophila]|jgi:bacteriorhodopsin|uniref:Uncharacterized protein n=2 Tax=Microvirga aerophila TaxID=670291 RepID=A0A512BXD2_9HYPH|nr:hypothetical protein MAE02_43040 [Microvirga aerophila]